MGQGTDLGAARGRIVIDTSQLAQAQQQVQSASRAMNQALNAIGVGVSVRQFAQYALEAENIATAYRRQSVAARELAGSQTKLNSLLSVYDRATGGVISQSQALSDVTRLIAVGFADSTAELDEFVRAVRGISLATGRPQEFVVTQLQLELLNQTGFRLDQIGLGMQEVRQKADELRAANSQLTEQQAYQQAVLTTANTKFGALTRSAEAQATEVEKLRKTWADLQLEMGQNNTSAVNAFAAAANQQLGDVREMVEGLIRDIRNAGIALQELNAQDVGVPGIQDEESFWTADPIGDFAEKADRAFSDWLARLAGDLTSTQRLVLQGSRERDAGRHPRRSGAPAIDTPRFDTAQTAAITQWARDVAQIERQAASARIDATRQFEEQRANTIRDYSKTIAREAYDFGVQRLRAEQDHARAIGDIRADAAQRELRMAEDLARTIGRARSDSAERLAAMQEDLDRTINQRRADSAERVAEWEEDRDETIAERREDSNKRLIEIEGEFAKERARAQRDHALRLNEAAASLDAKAIFFEQARFRQEAQDRLAARDEEVRSEKEKLDEAITQLNEAHQERLADEQRALDKSIDQANEAHQRQAADERKALERRIADANEAYQQQLEDARAADAERIADMEADFALRKLREDADRAVRLGRLATDHQAQLTEMAQAHSLRLAQISVQAADERAALDEEFLEQLDQLGVHNDDWLEKQKELQDDALDLFDEWWKEINKRLGVQVAPLPPNDGTPNGQRLQLQNEINALRTEQRAYPPGTPEWNDLANRIIELQRKLDALEGVVGPSSVSASSAMASTRFTYPTAVASAATGTGGRNLSLNMPITINGVPGQTAQELYSIIDSRILDTVRRATGAYNA